jgi:hypothetical protein
LKIKILKKVYLKEQAYGDKKERNRGKDREGKKEGQTQTDREETEGIESN